MCANDEVLCHEEYCPYARDYYFKLHQSGLVPRLLEEHSTLLPDAIYGAARESEICPFEISLELAGRSQVVVCDYNYAFDPYISMSDFSADGDLEEIVLVIDEIHNLVDRGRGYYSPELSSLEARSAAAALARGAAPVIERARALCADLAAMIERTVEAGLEAESGNRRASEAILPVDNLLALRPDFDDTFVDYLEHARETSSHRAEDPFVALYFSVLRFLDGLLIAEGDAFSQVVELTGGEAKLRIVCKDPSRFLGQVLNRAQAVIGLSATLSPPEFYRDLLGFDPERTSVLTLPSPFPAENRRVVLDDTVATTYRERPENYPLIAERLSTLTEAVPGNCMALFPSYVFLREVHDRLTVRGRRVLVQTREDSDKQRQEILDVLRDPLGSDCLLLAVAGGVFAEGVDYPGEMLRGVAVIGPCLPAVSLEQDLYRRYYQERFERGFEYAFVVPGMTRVVQAAGRLIRSADDFGIIALLDRRFLSAPYCNHLPEEWLPESGLDGLLGEPAAAAAEFFAGLVGHSD
jgi:DNA excision repair protein ERCC-2